MCWLAILPTPPHWIYSLRRLWEAIIAAIGEGGELSEELRLKLMFRKAGWFILSSTVSLRWYSAYRIIWQCWGLAKEAYKQIVILTDGFQYKKVLFGAKKMSYQAIDILSDIYCMNNKKFTCCTIGLFALSSANVPLRDCVKTALWLLLAVRSYFLPTS